MKLVIIWVREEDFVRGQTYTHIYKLCWNESKARQLIEEAHKKDAEYLDTTPPEYEIEEWEITE